MLFERLVDESTNSIHYSLGQIRFSQPLFEAHHEAATPFETSLLAFAEARSAVESISGDTRLSDIGKKEKITPVVAECISHLAGAWWAVSHFDQSILSRETALLKVPTLDPTHSACAIEDGEIRGYLRSLSPSERMSMLAEMQQDPAKHQRVQIAMLRSPIALLDQEARMLRQLWNDARRAENPAEAAAIDHGRESVDWARRGLAQLGGLFRTTNRVQDEFLLHTVMTDSNPRRATGYGVFGVSEQTAERYGIKLKQHLGYEKNAEGVWVKR